MNTAVSAVVATGPPSPGARRCRCCRNPEARRARPGRRQPLPQTRHMPSPSRSRSAPRARIALAVPSTSSASEAPEIRVSPMASAPRIKALWDMDLSPRTRAVPLSGAALRAVKRSWGLAIRASTSFDRPCQKWQTTPLSETGLHAGSITLVKAELGIKRVCPQCAARFYDLQKRPIECPKCEFSFEPESLYKQRRTRQPEPRRRRRPPSANPTTTRREAEESEEAESEEIVEAVPDEAPLVVSDDEDEVVEEEPEPESAGMSVVDADEEDVVADNRSGRRRGRSRRRAACRSRRRRRRLHRHHRTPTSRKDER